MFHNIPISGDWPKHSISLNGRMLPACWPSHCTIDVPFWLENIKFTISYISNNWNNTGNLSGTMLSEFRCWLCVKTTSVNMLQTWAKIRVCLACPISYSLYDLFKWLHPREMHNTFALEIFIYSDEAIPSVMQFNSFMCSETIFWLATGQWVSSLKYVNHSKKLNLVVWPRSLVSNHRFLYKKLLSPVPIPPGGIGIAALMSTSRPVSIDAEF